MSDIGLYEQTAGEDDSIESRITKYSYLVKKLAYHLLSRLPNTVLIDDLIQSGMVGLVEASQRFDRSKNVSFETYASIRIRGTMLDDLRKSSWMPRSVHHNMRRISAAIHKIECDTGTEAQAKDIAKELGVDINEYANMAGAAQANELFSLDDLKEETLTNDKDFKDPLEEALQGELKDRLQDLLKHLPQREQMVLAFYYSERLRFKEIGEVLGIGEARVCQIHGQAIARLQARLKRIINDEE